MKYSARFALAALLLLFFAPAPASAWQAPLQESPAQPDAVFFYPGEARLKVLEKLAPLPLPSGQFGFVLVLPANADRSTFSVSVDGRPAAGFYVLEDKETRVSSPYQAGSGQPRIILPGRESVMDPASEPLPERRAILEKLVPLKAAVAEKNGQLAAVEAQLELLKNHMAPNKENPLPPKALSELTELVSSTMPRLYADFERNKRELYNLRQRHDELQTALDEFDASRKFIRMAVPYSQTGREAELKYVYSVPSSYNMDYRLLAYPEKKSLVIEQEAVLSQQSGFAWKDVDVVISTAGRDRYLQPMSPAPWLISEQKAQPAPPPSARMASPNVAQRSQIAFGGMSQAPAEYAPFEAVAEQKSTFQIWKLGRQSIEPGSAVRLPMTAREIKADYYYTLRPASYFRAFLTAEINLAEPLELALGQARYFVDDVALGQNSFSFNGRRGSIFFGTDPQITGIMTNTKRSSGEKGFISKEQTMDWNWEIAVSNTRSYPVKIWVEDPAPYTTDDSFTLEVKSTPKPEQTTTALNQGSIRIYRWKLELKPGELYTIKHEVQLSAPTDKQVAPGRGDL